MTVRRLQEKTKKEKRVGLQRLHEDRLVISPTLRVIYLNSAVILATSSAGNASIVFVLDAPPADS